MVHGVLLARVEPHEASDLLQDVFVTALRRLPELREPAAFGGWLVRIARNRAADHHRRRRPTEELRDDSWVTEPAPTAEAMAVLRTIRSLPEAYRETLVLRLVEGMTGPEIALRTGLTAGSVRVNLHRGMKLLRKRLQGGTTDV
jgi:RNA polymerase sigma-70 factor (ECF subfamily)